jgi:RNA polymerase sigma factor (sigma-70 family)
LLEVGEAVENLAREGLIDELYNANHAAVLRVCSRILRNREDAADAAQQVFLIALESLDLTVRSGAARAWLLTVARNHCLDLLRRRKRLGKALVTLGSDVGRGVDMESAVADRDFVGVVFKQLSRRERQALWHSAVESRPLADIAGRLRLSYMAAAQVLHRARRHAVQVAARVAVVVGVCHLGRQRAGGGLALAATRLAAVAAVPVILVSIQSSSPTPQAASTASPTVSTVGSAPAEGGSTGALSASQLPPPVRGKVGVGGLTPGATTTLNSAASAVRQLLNSLPTVPPVLGKPAPIPLGSTLPSPPAIP